MAKQLMNLRGVPDDEADAVRALLSENGIDYYETPPNRWGLTMGAIWIRDDDAHPHARALLDHYQVERQRAAREAYAERRRRGEAETVLGVVCRHPGRSLFYLGAVALVLFLSIQPFLSMAR